MDWKLLHKTNSAPHAALLKGLLEENGIPTQILNKQDSMYLLALPGMHEIYVPAEKWEDANQLMQAPNSSEQNSSID